MVTSMPRYQTGAWTETPGPRAGVEIRHDLQIPFPKPQEVLVNIEFSGVCHSDLYGITGRTPMTTNISGHEGVGRVINVGTAAPETLLGKRVGIKWIRQYCKNCEICMVDTTCCPNQQNSGKDVPGTFQEYVVAPVEGLTIIPDSILSEHAAPLLCAGVTTYSAVLKTNLNPREWLAIPGAGGGLG